MYFDKLKISGTFDVVPGQHKLLISLKLNDFTDTSLIDESPIKVDDTILYNEKKWIVKQVEITKEGDKINESITVNVVEDKD